MTRRSVSALLSNASVCVTPPDTLCALNPRRPGLPSYIYTVPRAAKNRPARSDAIGEVRVERAKYFQ